MWSDHLFYCRPKLIFQHNGLFVFCDIVTIIMTPPPPNNIEEKSHLCILIYHDHIQ